MTVEKFYLPDTEEVRELLDSVWEDTYVDCLTPQAMKKFSENWEKLKDHSEEEEQVIVAIAALEEKNIVGIAIAKKKDEETVEIKRLYVLPNHQGQGIGKRLLTDVLIAFPEVEIVTLLVEKQNAPAISFYKKFNFVTKEVVEKKKNDLPLHLVRMEISLK